MASEAVSRTSLQQALPISGVASALLIPRSGTGDLHPVVYERQLHFLLSRGIQCFAVNGATGEYTLTTAEEFRCLLRTTRREIGLGRRLIAGVGGASVEQTRALCEIALDEGADGCLLPMPYFFPYGQDDLMEYVAAATRGLGVPVYLYNLPSFTTPLEPATSLELVERLPAVVGIKDSSGSLETVTLLRNRVPGAACILGNDGSLYEALAQGVCDGVVSGVSCVLPELMLRLYEEASARPNSVTALALKATLDEFISWLNKFPVPWGLKIIAEARGLGEAYFPLPLSHEKQAVRAEFVTWFEVNRAALHAVDDNVSV
ncbi:4-hydroxy-tetrahydrodipicolinate synthase [Bryocella elongata]|uniref:4-hydroxy-tetrahydrodipicolinate synthase n=1 Tax=Bryocella elongata TaxID=863522 RepID=A0A1H5UQ81_9BACT|nr:dihydrodipicolinate synthase family protein [Bryocella elongata]SEF77243.1 4-hydroxy-tetrahydrodipicolinate synthase [Bryocella elongata]